MKVDSYFIFFFLFLLSSEYSLIPEVKFPKENEITLRITKEANQFIKIIGKKGTITFLTDFDDSESNIFNISDIEEKTLFHTTIIDKSFNEYNVTCRIWKPKRETLRMFCTLNDSLKEELNYINITQTTFEYNNEYNITIISDAEDMMVYQINGIIPFIYSDSQEINIEKELDIYYLKFNVDLYNNELLELYYFNFNEIILDNCSQKGKELICIINKFYLEEILAYNGERFYINILIDYYGVVSPDNFFYIKFNYYNITKEDLYIEINKLKENIKEKDTLIAYETNITSINNVITETFRLNFNPYYESTCFFKKSENSNLLLLCKFESEGTYSLKPTENQTQLNNINIKYNFIILPIKNNETFIITEEYNTFIFNSYPRILDFRFTDKINITFTLTSIEDSKMKVKLNHEGDNLDCVNLLGLLYCIVPLSHFDYEENGYYNLNYINSRGSLSIYYEVSPFKVLLPKRNILELRIKQEDNQINILIGQKGTLYFITNYNDNETNIFDSSDIEEKTKFITTITDDEENYYNVNCRLFKPLNEKLVIICNLEENFKQEKQNVILNNVKLNYNGYNISIKSETSLKVDQLNYTIPFIYSDKQNIKMNEEIELYELKFKFDSYNKNDLLYIYGKQNDYTILDNCETYKKDLICKISKEKLESILKNKNIQFKLGNMNDNYGAISFDLVYDLNINYEIIKKIDLFITITKLLVDITESESSMAYDTNINSIPNLISDLFTLQFQQGNQSCYFKKNNINNLLIICLIKGKEEIYLGKIENEIILDDKHYKYNFRIQPVENKEVFKVDQVGSFINYVYPETLNFTSRKLMTIKYLMASPQESHQIKLNLDSPSYLECKDLINMKICSVPLSHFEDKGFSYYFYTHHLNHLGGYSTYYEINPFKVILIKNVEIGIEDKDNINLIKIGQKGILYFVTNYKDIDNILNPSELNIFTFEGNFTDSKEKENNYYITICKFWKPSDENIRIICQLNENLKNQEQNIYLKKINVIFKEYYNITINYEAENIRVKQLNYEISFLYSDKQEIYIKDEENEYKIIFKSYNYDKRDLYLYKNDIKAILLNNCERQNSELTCNINKDKILNILSYNGEKYSLMEKLDNEGLYIFHSVFDIIFNYNIIQREINIKIGKLLTPIVLMNEFIAYETNFENITNIITDYFEIKSEKNGIMNCLFKKSYNQKKLLFLCDALNEGKNSLGKIQPISFNSISIYYKFIIEESENNEIFHVSGNGTKITAVYPLLLNFTVKDNYMIKYETEYPERLNGIKLNSDSSSELNCTNKNWYKECTVNKIHFKKNGYYYTYHTNHQNSKTISYEAPMINVIFEPETKDDDNNYGLIFGISVGISIIIIILVSFLLWYYLKNKNKMREDSLIEEKQTGLGISVSSQVKEEIRQSEAKEERINQ